MLTLSSGFSLQNALGNNKRCIQKVSAFRDLNLTVKETKSSETENNKI